jgi:hypothetical protein
LLAESFGFLVGSRFLVERLQCRQVGVRVALVV